MPTYVPLKIMHMSAAPIYYCDGVACVVDELSARTLSEFRVPIETRLISNQASSGSISERLVASDSARVRA